MNLDPTVAERLFQEGRSAWLQNDLEKALLALRSAVAAAPQNAAYEYALGMALLKSGDLQNGYPLLNRWRRSLTGPKATPRLPIPPWTGEPALGRQFLIWGEDGFGDQLMYLRYAVELIERGAIVSWVCPPELSRIIASTGITALRNDQPFEVTGADFFLPSSSLPEAFGINFAAISGRPYIPLPKQMDRRARVGVIVSASSVHTDGPARSLPKAEAQKLLSSIETISLDPADTGAKDFYDTAVIMSGLNSVITVDTAAAHLAGALGIRTFTILPYVGDWKWFSDLEKSTWYDSITILRQPSPDDWNSPVDYALNLTR